MPIKKDSYIFNVWSGEIRLVELETNANNFYVEITSAGGAIGGLGNKSIEKLEKIKSVLKDNYDLTL